MVGQNRTDEFLEYIHIKTKGFPNSIPVTNDIFEDSIVITTGKQMLFSIKQMHQMISENQSNYLDLNRFLNATAQTLKYTHHFNNNNDNNNNNNNNNNKIWMEDDRFKFENQILLFVKDITSQITNLSDLLSNSQLKTEHNYISHQKNILKCLRFEVSSLSNKITHLIKERSKTINNNSNRSTKKSSNKRDEHKALDKFVDNIMKEHKITSDLSVLEEHEEKYTENTEISNVEMQEFSRENEEMMLLLEDEHKEIIAAEHKTAEIGDLLSMFTEHVINQSGVVTSIEGVINDSLKDLSLGNTELEKTKKKSKDARTVFITIVLTLTFSLLFLDWYK